MCNAVILYGIYPMHLQNNNINQWAFEFGQEHVPYISQEKVVTKPIPKIHEGVLNDRGIFRI